MDDGKGWEYKPDGEEASPAPDLQSPDSKNNPSANAPKGSDIISWTASEYIDHSRGPGWYLALTAGTIGFSALVYLVTKDYFAPAVVAFTGIIMAIFSTHKPRQVAYELSAAQLKAGEKVYPLDIFKSFAIIREGAVSLMNFIPVKRFMPPLSIYFDPADEERIVNLLGVHLPLEEGDLDGIERLARRLRF